MPCRPTPLPARFRLGARCIRAQQRSELARVRAPEFHMLSRRLVHRFFEAAQVGVLGDRAWATSRLVLRDTRLCYGHGVLCALSSSARHMPLLEHVWFLFSVCCPGMAQSWGQRIVEAKDSCHLGCSREGQGYSPFLNVRAATLYTSPGILLLLRAELPAR